MQRREGQHAGQEAPVGWGNAQAVEQAIVAALGGRDAAFGCMHNRWIGADGLVDAVEYAGFVDVWREIEDAFGEVGVGRDMAEFDGFPGESGAGQDADAGEED